MPIRSLLPSDAEAYRRIRQVSLAEVPQFVGPLAEQEAQSPVALLQTRLTQYESEGLFPFGFFVGNHCAGVAALSQKANPKYAHKVFFWGMYVMPEFRGRHIGRNLMKHRIDFARNRLKARFVSSQVTTTNKPSLALHHRFGFISCGVETHAMLLDGKFHDFELMHLDLNTSAQAFSE